MLRGFQSLTQQFLRFNLGNPSSLFPITANLQISTFNSLVFRPTNYFGKSRIATKNKPFDKWRILKGDKVIAISGKDKGKQGTVLKVYRKQNRVLVSGINQKMKRMKANMSEEQKGSIRPKLHPIHVSNVSLIDPETGKPTRVRFGYLAEGSKVRISKKTGSIIEKVMNPGWSVKNRIKNKIDGIADTPPILVTEKTYEGENFDKIKKEFEEYIQAKEKKETLLVFDD